MSRSTASLRVLRLAGVIAIVLIALAASMVLGSRSASPDGGFWESFRISALTVHRYSTLAEMLEASDGVVVAQVTGVEISRTVQGDAPEDVVTYARVDLSVQRVLSGDVPGVVPLEFLLGPTPVHAAADVLRLQQSIPRDPAVFFLHEKQGKGEQGLYRVTSTTGLWAATARGQLDAPLQEQPPNESGLYAAELIGVETVQGLADLLERFGSRL